MGGHGCLCESLEGLSSLSLKNGVRVFVDERWSSCTPWLGCEPLSRHCGVGLSAESPGAGLRAVLQRNWRALWLLATFLRSESRAMRKLFLSDWSRNVYFLTRPSKSYDGAFVFNLSFVAWDPRSGFKRVRLLCSWLPCLPLLSSCMAGLPSCHPVAYDDHPDASVMWLEIREWQKAVGAESMSPWYYDAN